MAFPAQFIDEVRARVGLADVIGRRVKLVRRGREHSGLCPFHNEKSPSFTLNEDKGFFHCFGCGKHGSVFDFVMETEGLNFPEAVEKLALEAGLQIPEQSPQAAARAEAQAGLYDVMELAAKWFTEQLAADAGQGARAYLRERKVGKQAMDGFRLGYSPESRTALKNYLLARQIPEEDIIEAGLVIKPDDGGDSYDRFRNRLMFPIADRRDRVIAFGGRALGEAKAKYLNSPETPIFHKGHNLYNLARARPSIRENLKVIVAEGYMDVIALEEGGFAYAVAPLGTAVTESQLEELWKLESEPVFCLDGDNAGLRAASRAAERALPILKAGCSLKFALLPKGEDPDTLVRGKGPEALTEVLDKALPLTEIIWRNEAAKFQLESPEGISGFENALQARFAEIGDKSIRELYGQHFARQFRTQFGKKAKWIEETERREFENMDGSRQGSQSRTRSRTPPPLPGGYSGGRRKPPEERLGRQRGIGDPSQRRIRLLLATLLNHPDLIERVSEEIVALEIVDKNLDRLRQEIIDIAGRGASLDLNALKAQLNERGLAAMVDSLIGNKATIIDDFVKPEATLDEAEAGLQNLLKFHHRNVDLAQLRKEFTPEQLFAKDDSDQGVEALRGISQVVEDEERLRQDTGQD